MLDRSELAIHSISYILLEEYNNDVSSINSLEKLWVAISLIYNRNNKGSKTDPWGTLPFTFPFSDRQIPYDTCYLYSSQANVKGFQ